MIPFIILKYYIDLYKTRQSFHNKNRCFLFIGNIQISGKTNSKMCGLAKTWLGHAATSFLDILMASAAIFLYWKENDDCVTVEALYFFNIIGKIKFGVHILEILLQCYVKETRQLKIDDPFNPRSFWAGILFTVLHVIKQFFTFLVMVSHIPSPSDTNKGCVHNIDVFGVMFVISGVVVILLRIYFHYRHKQSDN